MDRLLNILCRFLLLALIPATALLIWHGNVTAIEIKDFVVQLFCLAILCIATVRIFFLERIRIPKDPLSALVAFYGVIMFAGYFLSNRSSINTRALVPQLYGLLVFLITVHGFGKKHTGIIAALCTVTGTAAALYGIVQYLNIDPLNWMILCASKKNDSPVIPTLNTPFFGTPIPSKPQVFIITITDAPGSY